MYSPLVDWLRGTGAGGRTTNRTRIESVVVSFKISICTDDAGHTKIYSKMRLNKSYILVNLHSVRLFLILTYEKDISLLCV